MWAENPPWPFSPLGPTASAGPIHTSCTSCSGAFRGRHKRGHTWTSPPGLMICHSADSPANPCLFWMTLREDGGVAL